MEYNNKEHNNYLVTQSNQLIEANYSSNLTTLSYKVAKLLLSLINPKDENSNITIHIEISKIKQYLGWSKGVKWNRFRSDLKDIAKRLNKEPIEIQLDDGKLLTAFFLSSYILDFKNGMVSFDITPKLLPYLTNLKKNFTTYQLRYIPSLTSSYAIRIYELFYQYKKIGKRKFDVEDFVKKIGSPSAYKYNDLKKRVILPAQKQLKESTDIAFVFEELKTGRSITGLNFIILANKPANKNQLSFFEEMFDIEEPKEKSAFPETVIKALNELGISEQNLAKYLAKEFDIIVDANKRKKAINRCVTIGGYYLEKLQLLKNSTSAQSKNNSAGFFIKALTEDWTDTKTHKKQKDLKLIKEKKKTIAYINYLETKISNLNNLQNKVSKPIIEELLNNEEVAISVYNNVIGKIGSFFKRNNKELLSKSIIEQYHSSAILASYFYCEFSALYPVKFEKNYQIQKEIDKYKSEIQNLKQQWK